MKKSYIRLIGVVLILSLSTIGCAQKNNTTDSGSAAKQGSITEEKTEKEPEDNKAEDTTEQTKPSDSTTTTVEEPTVKQSFTVYYSNDNADGLNQEEISQEVSEANVWKALIDKGVVPADATVISLKETTVDGEDLLELDLSKTFSSFLSNMGTAGETIIIHSVTDTFLNAYEADKIKITVEGSTMTTGHAEYPGYMEFFN